MQWEMMMKLKNNVVRMIRVYGQTSIGVVGVAMDENVITEVLLPRDVDTNARFADTCKWDEEGEDAIEQNMAGVSRNLPSSLPPLVKVVFAQIRDYLAGERSIFTLPIRLDGTPFQRRVWDALQEIPYGTVTSYGEIASRIGTPRAVRAVGAACGRNPIPLLVPSHRVVGKQGQLTGFRGGLELKRRLLELEKSRRME